MPKNSKGREVAEIVSSKCIACQLCLAECPFKAINVEVGTVRVNPELCVGCGKCVDVCPAKSILFEKPLKRRPVTSIEPATRSDYGGIAVFIETRDGAGAEVSWELVGKARELADKINSQVIGFVLGTNIDLIAIDAVAYGCDVVYMMESPMLQTYVSKIYGQALTQLCLDVEPESVLLGATPLGRDLSGIVATRLETGLTADCTGLDVDTDEKVLLMMTRPTFGGNIMATITCKTRRPQMSTVRPRVMPMPHKDLKRKGEVISVKYAGHAEVVPRILEFIPAVTESGGMDITRAPVLVVVGRGACEPKHFPMLEELARLLGGTIACSRPVVEAGLLPYLRQVGQTGKTVAPKIYIGVGVSGAVQHQVGMTGSQKVIAINVDPQAPLMREADYAIVGDYLKVIPELVKGIKQRLPTSKLVRQKHE